VSSLLPKQTINQPIFVGLPKEYKIFNLSLKSFYSLWPKTLYCLSKAFYALLIVDTFSTFQRYWKTNQQKTIAFINNVSPFFDFAIQKFFI